MFYFMLKVILLPNELWSICSLQLWLYILVINGELQIKISVKHASKIYEKWERVSLGLVEFSNFILIISFTLTFSDERCFENS